MSTVPASPPQAFPQCERYWGGGGGCTGVLPARLLPLHQYSFGRTPAGYQRGTRDVRLWWRDISPPSSQRRLWGTCGCLDTVETLQTPERRVYNSEVVAEVCFVQ
ncbi:unnamed protein product [Arctogadus glacialis]